jgi:phosphatidylethanolamine-binding protein (PEBP) family uncharacterized protein
VPIKTFVISTLCLVSTSCFSQAALDVDFMWKRANRCSATSPALQISGIPAGTKSLKVTLVDHDAPGFDHGGGVVEHADGPSESVAEGALKSYRGPCPPSFQFGHEYEFKVTAIAADGKTELASGIKTKTFSAKAVAE